MKQLKLWMTAAILISGTLVGHAQDMGTFNIATLNVDGLPQKILVAKVNPDGPGGGGSVRIGRYLQKKGYDMVFMQEDFNYHEELTVPMEDDYQMDSWSGNVEIDGHQIDFLHLQNHRFGCDGLMGAWQKGIVPTSINHTPWKANFGKFSHSLDEMVTKGFRRYELTLPASCLMTSRFRRGDSSLTWAIRKEAPRACILPSCATWNTRTAASLSTRHSLVAVCLTASKPIRHS